MVNSGKIPYPSGEHPESELSISAITKPTNPSPAVQLIPIGTHAWHGDVTVIVWSQFGSSPIALIITGIAPLYGPKVKTLGASIDCSFPWSSEIEYCEEDPKSLTSTSIKYWSSEQVVVLEVITGCVQVFSTIDKS